MMRKLSTTQIDALLGYRREERLDIAPEDIRANTRQSLVRLGLLTPDGQLTDLGRDTAFDAAQPNCIAIYVRIPATKEN